MQASKRWLTPDAPREEPISLAAAIGSSTLVASLLRSRGVEDAEAAERFLNPSLEHLHDPALLPDIGLAVERLAKAIEAQELILVHGDYDADGICSAALLTRVLTVLNANVEVFVPHRRRDGYDLSAETVESAAARGVRLIITVDCGVMAFEAARRAAELGVDLIVTDHHEPRPDGTLPACVAVVNPMRHDSQYPFPKLCGTGVAYKVACALGTHLGMLTEGLRIKFLDLVAIATVADCMPLVDENRVLVAHGLDVLRRTNKEGLKALMRIANVAPAEVTSRTLGFTIGPRINAVGRIDDAEVALRLLLTRDAEEAGNLAATLEKANTDRQAEQERILADAMRQAEQYLEAPILVLASPNWHMGIIGIVAGKIAETFSRPCVLIAIDEEAGRGRGSCRSGSRMDIFAAINECRSLLNRCGGHQAAAGFDIQVENINAFREALTEVVARTLDLDDCTPSVQIHAEIVQHQLGIELARDVQRLAPFGQGNPEPVLLSRRLEVQQQQRTNNRFNPELDHLKLRLRSETLRAGLEAILWRGWPRAGECPAGSRIDACFTLSLRRWQGMESVQLTLEDLARADAPPAVV